MIILHGTYENGKIKILDNDLPESKSDVEIRIEKKSWQRKINQVSIKGEPLSKTIVRLRYEE
ncbi:MAG: hypothetical protein ACP5QT_03735 [Brevinematia bacterium]